MQIEKRKKMGEAGVQRVKDYYTFSDNMAVYEQAIKQAVIKNDY